VTFLADENFNADILYGIWRLHPEADILTVQDEQLRGQDDATVLEHAGRFGLVVLTHDLRTMPGYAAERMSAGLPMPGLIAVPKSMPLVRAIEDVMLIVMCSRDGEYENQIRYLPL
jgi:hypothetical protein